MTWDELKGSDWDWEQAWGCVVLAADLHLEESDLTDVIAHDDGENGGDSWLAVINVRDGRVALLRAWCDYTGWG